MTASARTCRRMKRPGVLLLVAGILAVFTAVFLWLAACFECEFPFWPTLWLASRTKTPSGERVTDLIRARSGKSYQEQHWHHCTWCDVVYPHAPHLVIKVNINEVDTDFYLFDWDVRRRKLLPVTVRSAKLFPELIPKGCVVEPLGVGLNPQLYHDDQPCRIIRQPAGK